MLVQLVLGKKWWKIEKKALSEEEKLLRAKVDKMFFNFIILNYTIKTRMDGAGGLEGGQSFDLCNFSLPFLILLLQKMEKLNNLNFWNLTIEERLGMVRVPTTPR